jgi:hypothetical protein
MFGDILEEKKTHLHSFTTATSRGSIVFVRRTILLNPKRMCPIFNKTSMICWYKVAADITFRMISLPVTSLVKRVVP